MRATACAATILIALGGLAAASPIAHAQTPAEDGSLRDQLQALAKTHGFEIKGIETVRDTARIAAGGSLEHRLTRLLAAYDFVILRDDSGRIARVVLSRYVDRAGRPPAALGAPDVRTVRKGFEHYVEAEISGPGGTPRRLRFLIDTGASAVVLPESMIEGLGFASASLETVRLQTANGLVSGRVASLARVRVGDAEARDVLATFVPDGQLGGRNLLGMSFLGRFVMTIDDATSALRLEAREGR